MKYINRDKNTRETIISHKKIAKEISNHPLLSKYLGEWIKSSRVKGWGRSTGYIQVREDVIDIIGYPNEYKPSGVCIRRVHYKLGAKVHLSCEHPRYKEGWTEEHYQALKSICDKYGVKLD